MTEYQANQITLWLIGVIFPIVGVAKLFLANTMVRNTHTRTRIGDWLIRMFVSMSVTLFLIGLIYMLALMESYQWYHLPIWTRWWMRAAAVASVILAFVSTAMLVKTLIPLLKDAEIGPRIYEKPHMIKELATGTGMVLGASAVVLVVLMMLVDWV
jgi:hypothetical protein